MKTYVTGKHYIFCLFFFLMGFGFYSNLVGCICEHVKWFAVGNPSHKCSSAGIPLFIWDVTFVGFKYEKKATSFLKKKSNVGALEVKLKMALQKKKKE